MLHLDAIELRTLAQDLTERHDALSDLREYLGKLCNIGNVGQKISNYSHYKSQTRMELELPSKV